jgi:hypothetical protein
MSTAAVEHLRAQAREKLEQAQEIAKKAHDNGRPLTTYERGRVEALLADVDTLNGERKGIDDSIALTQRIDELNARMHHPQAAPGAKSFADHLIEGGLGQRPDRPHAGFSAKSGIRAVEVPGYPIFGPDGTGAKAVTAPAIADMPRRVEPGIVQLGADQRFAFPMFPSIDAGDALVISDYRQTVRGAPSGTVERSPVATIDKATLPVTVAVANDPMSQVAIILDGIPVAVVEALPQFRTFADNELRFQLFKALDAHVYTKVNTGASFGNTGTGLIAQLRNAVASLQAAGYSPDLAIVNPADAVTLDLTQDTAGSFVFALRDTGDSSPLWGLRVVVRAGTTGTEPPLVVDTARIGALYLGSLAIDLDPYAGVGGANFKKNLVDIRAEQNALMHVRAPTAARRIAAT